MSDDHYQLVSLATMHVLIVNRAAEAQAEPVSTIHGPARQTIEAV